MIVRFSRYILILSIILLSPYGLFAQLSSGGIPPGFKTPESDEDLTLYSVSVSDFEHLLKSDDFTDKSGEAQRIGVLLPLNINPAKSSDWKQLPDGSKQWRIRIQAEGAGALALYYQDFHLPEGCSLFIYNRLRTKVIGAFTHLNNHESGSFANELIPGEELIVELLTDNSVRELPAFNISEVLYAFNNEDDSLYDFGDSGPCNVNVNCSEGANWQNQKRGVVKIQGKVGNVVLRCSGSLINNTKLDFKPYIFTADHCARTGSTYANEQDMNQWVFYFNFESETCENPEDTPPETTLTGASMKANVGGGSLQMGSDFCLVLLNNNIPPIVNPYFNGWSRLDIPSPNGVTIHHPQGDIKKISTYNTPLISSAWNFSTPNMYWQTRWAETENGHGVTEGGSSGSPLFNDSGLIIGQLTGGESGCSAVHKPDYYGKFAVSWEYGSEPMRQLKYWLDPENTGADYFPGSYDQDQVIALFVADTTVIQTGSSVTFSNISIGEPTEYHWIFNGGEPSEVFTKDPGKITYNKTQTLGFDVTLIVKNESRSDTLVRKQYIKVFPGIYPNPADKYVSILLGSHDYKEISVEILDMQGIRHDYDVLDVSGLHSVKIKTHFLKNGVYVINLSENGISFTRKKLIITRK
ncbi:MAG TPA: T9SS type A sorting domain-containing protein [Bacteroidales bacterium]|nr:T9SS type A sorting domain-containing protein [Bacteroidales bacterium]